MVPFFTQQSAIFHAAECHFSLSKSTYLFENQIDMKPRRKKKEKL
jgi:hypothetical protein